jgi:hypothetical protein
VGLTTGAVGLLSVMAKAPWLILGEANMTLALHLVKKRIVK